MRLGQTALDAGASLRGSGVIRLGLNCPDALGDGFAIRLALLFALERSQ